MANAALSKKITKMLAVSSFTLIEGSIHGLILQANWCTRRYIFFRCVDMKQVDFWDILCAACYVRNGFAWNLGL